MRRQSLDADLLVLGGGCAGLSLASRLARAGHVGPRTMVLETRTRYTNDRTWCFWARPWHEHQRIVANLWPAWRFSSGSRVYTQRMQRDVSYQCIPVDAFYAGTRRAIETSCGISLHTGIDVRSVTSRGDHVRVETSAGSLTARWAIDTRPPRAAARKDPTYAQVFSGAEVEVGAAVFDPGVAGLMLGMSCDEHGFRFTYLLPFSSCRALVEETRFTADNIGKDVLDASLGETLERLSGGADFNILRREAGRIPMAVMSRPRAAADGTRGLVLKAGTSGGAVRPSTGYAFARIQRWVDHCARELAAGRPPVAHPPDPAWRRGADALFLRVIRRRPALAPALFMAMARGVSPLSLVRFLSDEGRIRDFLRVIAALPKRPFLGELVMTGPAAGGRA